MYYELQLDYSIHLHTCMFYLKRGWNSGCIHLMLTLYPIAMKLSNINDCYISFEVFMPYTVTLRGELSSFVHLLIEYVCVCRESAGLQKC